MKRLQGPLGGGLIITALALLLALSRLQAQGENFDRLSDPDRQALQKRFEKELWPLLTRHERDGCVGCHAGNKIVSALRMTGKIDKDFPMLIKQGFFIPNDKGSLLSRMLEKDPKRVMPPPTKDGKLSRPQWTADEMAILRAFVNDLEEKTKEVAP